ncbi:MAG: ATP-binding protein, partial [Methanolinea sp.]
MDRKLENLLQYATREHEETLDALVQDVDELENVPRQEVYFEIAEILRADPVDVDRLIAPVNRLVSLTTYGKVKFKAFLRSGKFAQEAIRSLLRDFPEDDGAAAERIDAFIRNVSARKYPDYEKGLGMSDAALICSILLTSAFPDRFVDFGKNRWENLAQLLGYGMPGLKSSYGQWIVWAGRFAREVAGTATFRKHWKSGPPLWSVAGLCWHVKDLPPPFPPNEETETEKKAKELLPRKKQVILYGPPGTGKTYAAMRIARSLAGNDYSLAEKTFGDRRVFSISIWPPRDGDVFSQKPGDLVEYKRSGIR